MPSGPKSVLQMLWSFASKWRPGDGSRFVWPSVETVAVRLGRKVRGVYANLTRLEREGWIVRDYDEKGRKGWTLHPVAVAPRMQETQLGIAWPSDTAGEAANSVCAADAPRTIDGRSTDDLRTPEPLDFAAEVRALTEELRAPRPQRAAAPCVQPVERDTRCAISEEEPCNPARLEVQSPKRKEAPMKSPSNQDTVGQDSLRVFRSIEQYRVARLGTTIGGPARPYPKGDGLIRLWRELGANAKAWKLIEQYGRRAIDLAALAVEQGADNATKLVKWRSDGGEWDRARYDAVMRWQGAGAEPCTPSAPPPPDPIVDGVRVDMHEREAWDEGGEVAVRKQRAATLDADKMAAQAADFLATLRGVG